MTQIESTSVNIEDASRTDVGFFFCPLKEALLSFKPRKAQMSYRMATLGALLIELGVHQDGEKSSCCIGKSCNTGTRGRNRCCT